MGELPSSPCTWESRPPPLTTSVGELASEGVVLAVWTDQLSYPQTHIQGFEVAHPNIYTIYNPLEA